MQNKQELIKYLKKFDAKNIKMLYEVISHALLINEDFRLAGFKKEEDLCPVIEKESGERIDFALDTIIGKKSYAVFASVEAAERENKKLKKQERIELLADILTDAALFEGVCLTIDESEDVVRDVCRDMGCADAYELLSKDPVYQARKAYMRKITQYTKAAINLYGVLHLVEMEDIIRGYEKNSVNTGVFARENGSYANTIIFNPRYMGLCTLQHLIGNVIPFVGTTMDGLMVHKCFFDELQMEHFEWLDKLKERKNEVGIPDLDAVLSSLSPYSYRELYFTAMEKPMYKPGKMDFLKFADELYYEMSPESKKLRRYLGKNFGAAFARHGAAMGFSKEECLDNFMDLIYEEASDYGKGFDTTEPNEFIQFVLDIFYDHGISLADMTQMNEVMNLVIQMKNTVRLWMNHGHSPMEISRLMPNEGKSITVVPGSTKAARMMAETREELEKLGIHTDIDATAAVIPAFSFPDGIKGDVEVKERKVYPNDPCPCGSGKKFKKCCGRGL